MTTASSNMSALIPIVVFSLDEQHYALPLDAVERIVRAVEIMPLPGAPAAVLGAIDVEGRVIPVINLRRRCRLPERDISLADHLLIAHTAERTVALVVDAVQGVSEHPATEIAWSAQIASGLEHIQGVVKLHGGRVLIQDPEAFLSVDKTCALGDALSKETVRGI